MTASSPELLWGEEERRFYAMDVYRAGALPRAVARPKSTEELQTLITWAAGLGLAIIVRGGGVSYTDAYLPETTDSIVVDTALLNHVIELNELDMYVTVEPGITWHALDRALAPKELRVPFLGTFSGLAATVGGTLSQNANGHGSNAYGISPDSVLSLELLTGRGQLISTGHTLHRGKSPYFRNFGPDVTGIFTGDCGALGIKTAITLKLQRRKPAFATASFSFDSFPAMHACMRRVAAERIDEKSFGLDLNLSQGQIARQGQSSRLAIARNVWQSSPSARTGISALLRMLAAGTRQLASAPYAAHYIVDGHGEAETRGKISALRRIAVEHGREIANSVPTIVKSNPFQPLHNMLGPAGERWVPLHGLLPHSKVLEFHGELTAYVEESREKMRAASVHTGAMFSCIGCSTFLYEPAFYWKDSRTPFHERMMDADYVAQLPVYPPNSPGAALVERLRTDIIGMMSRHGAAHFQIGKLYPYLKSRDEGSMSLLRALKRELDPDNRLNPGALGL